MLFCSLHIRKYEGVILGLLQAWVAGVNQDVDNANEEKTAFIAQVDLRSLEYSEQVCRKSGKVENDSGE